MYVSCDEYFVATVDTSEYHRVSQPVWQCQSGGSDSACDSGNVFQYSGGGNLLQSDGEKIVNSVILHGKIFNQLSKHMFARYVLNRIDESRKSLTIYKNILSCINCRYLLS